MCPIVAGGRTATVSTPSRGPQSYSVQCHRTSGKTDLTFFVGSQRSEGFSEGCGIKRQGSHSPVHRPASAEMGSLESQKPCQYLPTSPTGRRSARQMLMCMPCTPGVWEVGARQTQSPKATQSPVTGPVTPAVTSAMCVGLTVSHGMFLPPQGRAHCPPAPPWKGPAQPLIYLMPRRVLTHSPHWEPVCFLRDTRVQDVRVHLCIPLAGHVCGHARVYTPCTRVSPDL